MNILKGSITMEKNVAKELTYEEALKAFKAEWADKRKEARKAESASKKAELRAQAVEACKQALTALEGVDKAFSRELEAVVTRLNMFVKGERYTRTSKGV